MHRCPRQLLWFLVICLGLGAAGQLTAQPAGEASKPDPSIFSGLHVDIAYQQGLDDANKDQLYYRLAYRTLAPWTHGTEPKAADAVQSAVHQLSEADSDLLSIIFERGQGTAHGAQFDSLGLTKPFAVPWIKQLRGAFRVSGSLDGDNFGFDAGAESPPIALLGSNTDIANWLIFGLSGEARDDKADPGKDSLLGTYRAFLGHGWGWTVDVTRWPPFVDVIKLAPSYLDALKITPPVGSNRPYALVKNALGERKVPSEIDQDRTMADLPWVENWKGLVPKAIPPGQDLAKFLETYPDIQTAVGAYLTEQPDETLRSTLTNLGVLPAMPDDEWRAKLTVQLKIAKAPVNQATTALWLESCGWYTITGDETAGKRYNNMFAATLTRWLNPKRGANNWLRVRYENGRDRAVPEDARNRVLFSLGTSF